ncbi:MAG: CopG family transcriptional regulator [Planctomycetaceae bacterium]|nr:ribbon-helix-helix domain-containing protein [Planctomycetaceae bacterium]
MIRTQIQFSEEQSTRIREEAKAKGVSLSELVREGMEQFLRSRPRVSRQELKQRTVDALGRFECEITDLSVNHDKYLAEDFGS